MATQNHSNKRTDKVPGGGALLAGMMIGSLVGAGTMLLLALQSGKRMRQKIQLGALDLRDRARDRVIGTASEFRARAERAASDVRDTVDQLATQDKGIAIEQLDRVAAAAKARKRALQASWNG